MTDLGVEPGPIRSRRKLTNNCQQRAFALSGSNGPWFKSQNSHKNVNKDEWPFSLIIQSPSIDSTPALTDFVSVMMSKLNYTLFIWQFFKNTNMTHLGPKSDIYTCLTIMSFVYCNSLLSCHIYIFFSLYRLTLMIPLYKILSSLERIINKQKFQPD